MITTMTFRNGLKAGLQTAWQLGKIIFPITFIVSVLQYTPVIGWIEQLFAPVMGLVGLNGEAAIVLALGTLVNLYAAIGAILGLTLSIKQIFILAVMLSFAHNLIIESVVARKVGVSAWLMALIRLVLAFLMAALVNLVYQGGSEIVHHGGVIAASADPTWQAILYLAFMKAVSGILRMLMIVLPVMLFIQVLKDIHVLQKLARLMQPFTKLLGVHPNSAVAFLAGLIFGLAYGAGVMIQAAEEEGLSKKDLYLMSFFLVACHAIVEDTLVFLPLGINVLPLLLLRFSVALVMTVIISRVWKRIELNRMAVAKG
ncbi:nucleoside recognition domain-containing protein [Rubeoparvulum massiliense]|uniref:nucleoside recognition domain-containing protein n=1 Tax=Rubeoparvulum massiliense TaxID=1631346 RepID=UPI0009E26545|nr:nucleoside recognition domain-containing protein [Rubeoparvulum massiliense]